MRSTSKFSQMGTGAAGQAARNVTSMNKRRYVDLRHNFDLDLTYINDEIIAMGVPARGFVALYRNPSGEVVRFFTSRHKDHYRIYNFCPELPYPSKLFDDRVRCYDVQDHTPPPMNTLIEFLEDAGAFTAETRGHAADEPKNVIAVHCRGGKGRTGSAVCSWLLYSKFSVDAPTALRYFAETRTELRKGSKKLQGVDTPSQKRYIVQLDQLLTRTGAYHGTEVPLRPIPDTRIALNRLTVSGYFARPHDERGPLVAAVHQNGPGGGQIIFVSPPLNSTTVMTNELVFDLKGFVVGGDIRVTVFEQGPLKKGVAQGLVLADAPGLPKGPKDLSKRKIAGKEPGVLFYFLFHTEFVDHTVVKKDVGVVKGGGGGAGELAVPMPMMDKAFHNKRKRYDPCGIAVLSTSPAAAPPVAPVAALKAVPTHPTSPPPPLPPRNPLTKGGGHNVDLDAEGSPEEPPASLPSPPGESKLPVAASLILMPEPELEPRFEEVEEQEDPLGLHTLHRAASMAVEDAVTAIHQSASGFFL